MGTGHQESCLPPLFATDLPACGSTATLPSPRDNRVWYDCIKVSDTGRIGC